MTKPFKITFCGDTSLGYYYLEKGKNRYSEAYDRLKNNPFSFFEGVAPLLEGSDEVIVNLETVLTKNPGKPIEGKEYPGCDDPDVTISVLKKLGVTAVTLANNHAMDFGEEKLVEMIDLLHANGIATIGAGRNIEEARKPYVVTVPESGQKVYILNGMRARKRYIEYGFFATKEKPGIASTNMASMKKIIKDIRKQDANGEVIVIPHWQGIDYNEVGEKQTAWCKGIITEGASAVVGHGSHKRDEVLVVDNKPIYLSIGNFVFNSPGRYAAKGVDPFSMVVSMDVLPKLNFNNYSILTDNKKTDFKVVPVNENLEFNSKEIARKEPDGLTIETWLSNASVESNYDYHGSVNALCSGFDSAFNDYRKNLFFVVLDTAWPARFPPNQRGKSLSRILELAMKKNYSGFVINREAYELVKGKLKGQNIIVVDNVFSFMINVSKYSQESSGCCFLGITGSAGKSSTYSMMKEVISEYDKDSLLVSKGENRNLFRDVLSLKTKSFGYKYCLMEVAGSAFTYANDDFFVSPNVAIVTNITEAHGSYLGGTIDVAKTKSKLLRRLPNKSVVILNAEMDHLDIFLSEAKGQSVSTVLYGESVHADVHLKNYDFSTGIVEAKVFDKHVEYFLGAHGKHMALNSLAVVAAAYAMHIPIDVVKGVLRDFKPEGGRGQKKTYLLNGKKITVLDESYNANPLSMRVSLELIGNF